jgi:hypothetical protein
MAPAPAAAALRAIKDWALQALLLLPTADGPV